MFKNKSTASDYSNNSTWRKIRNNPRWVFIVFSTGAVLLLVAIIIYFGGEITPGFAGLTVMENSGNASSRFIRIQTSRDGIYHLQAEDLRKAGFSADFESGDLHLLNQGIDVPFWMGDGLKDTELTFYAWKSNNPYLDGNIYWLVQGELPDALKAPAENVLGEVEAPPAAPILSQVPSGAYVHYMLIDNNNQYFPQATEGDHWFDFILAAPGVREITFDADSIVTAIDAQAAIRLTLWASSESPENPDHHWRIFINGNLIADELWEGRGLYDFVLRFSSTLLIEGQNTLTLESPVEENFRVDVANLDKIEIEYPRYPSHDQNSISFTALSNSSDIHGFKPGLRVFNVTDRYNPEVLGYVSSDGRLPAGIMPMMKVIVISDDDFLDPSSISPMNELTDVRDNGGAEYIIVAPGEFLPTLQPLLDFRASEGMSTFAADIEDIYNQFNYGIPDPIAVNKFLKQMMQTGDIQPRYLLLVGDATYDPRGYIALPEANRLPTFLVQTVYGGQTASDVGFVQLNEDRWPDLPVGRVPARDTDQVAAFVQKTLAYEMPGENELGEIDVFAIADGQDPSFKWDAEEFLDLFPGTFNSSLYAPQAGVEDGADEIRKGFQSGADIVAYFGHGSVDTWGKDKLFGVENVADLKASSGRTPVVFNLTCLTGLFTHPLHESLTEALLFTPPDRGAVAILAPSSLTLPTDQSFLSQPLIEALLDAQDARLGDIHLFARRQVPIDSPTSRDVMYTFMLFGDPALHIDLTHE